MYDYFSPDGNADNTETPEELIRCTVSGYYYPSNEMAFDKDGACYIHRDNLDSYLSNFMDEMPFDEFNELKINLKNQIK